MSGLNSCNIILVENIPFGTKEIKLREIFQQVGPIVSFRLAFEKENKQSTGYCYCEYHGNLFKLAIDPATAASAIRNLNNVEMEDQRLMVGYADNKPPSTTNEVYRLDPSFKTSAQQLSQQQQRLLSDKPESSSGMNEVQLLDVLLTLQLYSQSTNEDRVKELLLQNPLLAYDLFKILFELDLVDGDILKLIISEQKQPVRTCPTTFPTSVMTDLTFQPSQLDQIQMRQPYQEPQQQQKPLLQHQYPQHLQLQQLKEREQQNVQQQPPQQYQQIPFTIPSMISQNIQQSVQQSLIPHISTMQGIQSAMFNYGSQMQNSGVVQALQTGTNLNSIFMSDLQIQEQNATIILQLLNLTPQQVEMLPPEQKSRILALQQRILRRG
ncbi:227_t:CDS:2 [Funneliformis geosporum]|uniref:227_t:CDS:1 n=1 Tax=Funneliformis geosporum TaxID=1117311 RepID=A0A9W4SPT7_9GLOM|nr:227_t:CDS:2 [Funneliformis geosporum]